MLLVTYFLAGDHLAAGNGYCCVYHILVTCPPPIPDSPWSARAGLRRGGAAAPQLFWGILLNIYIYMPALLSVCHVSLSVPSLSASQCVMSCPLFCRWYALSRPFVFVMSWAYHPLCIVSGCAPDGRGRVMDRGSLPIRRVGSWPRRVGVGGLVGGFFIVVVSLRLCACLQVGW